MNVFTTLERVEEEFKEVGAKEFYFTENETKDGDIFLLEPNFFQATIFKWMEMQGINPAYLVIADKDEEVKDPAFREYGIIANKDNAKEAIKFFNLAETKTMFRLIDDFIDRSLEEKELEDKKKSSLSTILSPLKAINNFLPKRYYPAQASGSDLMVRREAQIKLHYIMKRFDSDDSSYTVVFSATKAYLFDGKYDDYALDDYVVSILNNKSANNNVKHKVLEDRYLMLKIDDLMPIPISDDKIYQDFYDFIISKVDSINVDILFGFESKSKFDKQDFYNRYTLYFLSLILKNIKEIKEEKETLAKIIFQLAYKKFFNFTNNMEISGAIYDELLTKINNYSKDSSSKTATTISEFFEKLESMNSEDIFKDDINDLLKVLKQNIIQTKETKKKVAPQDELTTIKIGLQKKILKHLSEDLEKKIKAVKGQRFQKFEELKEEIRKEIDNIEDSKKRKKAQEEVRKYYCISEIEYSENDSDKENDSQKIGNTAQKIKDGNLIIDNTTEYECNDRNMMKSIINEEYDEQCSEKMAKLSYDLLYSYIKNHRNLKYKILNCLNIKSVVSMIIGYMVIYGETRGKDKAIQEAQKKVTKVCYIVSNCYRENCGECENIVLTFFTIFFAKEAFECKNWIKLSKKLSGFDKDLAEYEEKECFPNNLNTFKRDYKRYFRGYFKCYVIEVLKKLEEKIEQKECFREEFVEYCCKDLQDMYIEEVAKWKD